MLAALLPWSYYEFYVAALHAAVQLAVVLSLLVSADRVLNVGKFAFIKLRARLTGRLPKDDWFYAALPEDPDAHPKASSRGSRGRGSARSSAGGLHARRVGPAEPVAAAVQSQGWQHARQAGRGAAGPMSSSGSAPEL